MTRLDITKPVQTRDGQKARILCDDLDRRDGRILAVAVASDDTGGEYIVVRYPDGSVGCGNHDNDIVNVPETVEVLVHFYRNDNGFINASRLSPEQRARFLPYDEHLGSKLVVLTIGDAA
jgi:hypothetical protein